jgi:hypothetical protein
MLVDSKGGSSNREMTKHCPTCNCRSGLLSADDLLRVLAKDATLEVYRGDGTDRWFLTRGFGETSAEAVQELATREAICPVYSTTTDCYHVGKTIDMARSIFNPKTDRRIVYVEAPAFNGN